MKKNIIQGFTLMEILVYIGVLSIIISVAISCFLWTSQSLAKNRATLETINNGKRAMDAILSEIREAKSIYEPATTSTQLSLETNKYPAEGETSSYIDFYLCEERLCLKKEGQAPLVLTSEKVRVDYLAFNRVNTASTTPSVQIVLSISHKAASLKPALQASFAATSTASLRTY